MYEFQMLLIVMGCFGTFHNITMGSFESTILVYLSKLSLVPATTMYEFKKYIL